jgi:hypothetical protein
MSEGESNEFLYDLPGRVRNLGLPPSQMNALFPLFEAVSNAFHAIEARLGRKASIEGLIRIEVHRVEGDENASITGFTVCDNGIGMDVENWRSFRTADSPHKLTRGGKGVGRLSWLKVFQNTKVDSSFEAADSGYRRQFSFRLPATGSNPIIDPTLVPIKKGSPGTAIALAGFNSGFDAVCPRKTETIAAKLIGHFLQKFVSDEAPAVQLVDQGKTTDLRQFYNENIVAKESVELSAPEEGGQRVSIVHILLRKALKLQEGGKHWLLFAGDGRIVQEENIDGQLGLGYVGPNADCVYLGLVGGSLLDGHTNQERTTFTLERQILRDIHSQAIAAAKSYLSVYIEGIRDRQAQAALRIIKDNPQFISVTDDVRSFAEEHLTLNTSKEEDIYLELSRQKLRIRRRVAGEIRRLHTADGEDLDDKVQMIARAINLDKKGSLAEYVIKRKEILDILDESLAYIDPEKRDYLREEIVHDLLIPIRSDSDSLDYEDHNLWVLDDRLAFYSYFKSDKPFSTYLEDSTSRKEADVAVVFDRSLAFDREGRDEPIVIVEFKRPGRNDYDGNSNPVSQVLKYVDEIRKSTSVVDKDGKHRRKIGGSTRFICYVVADFTEKLIEVVRLSPANNPTSDGEGFFGYSREHNAYVEVVPYQKVLSDARIRNEAFFSKLGLA